MFNPRPGTPAWYSAPVGSGGGRRWKRLGGRIQSSELLRKKRRLLTRGIKPELKYLDGTQSSHAANGTYVINEVAEGTDYSERVGRLIHGRYVQLDIMCTAPTGNTNPDSGIVHLVLDKQPNNTWPGYTDIFDTTTIAAGQAFRLLSKNSERFKILKTWMIGPIDHTCDLQHSRVRSYLMLRGAACSSRYLSNLAAIPESGSLLVAFASYTATGDAATQITFNLAYRFAFVDA